VNSFQERLAKHGPHARWKKPSTSDAFAYCQDLARVQYENFSVISWFLPTELHPHFASIYAYCRWSDDLADEVNSNQESLELLSWWEDQLEKCYQGETTHPVFVALARTIQEFSIPIQPFKNLLTAFRLDQSKKRYETFDDLLAYCRNSADPVGQLVMYLGECFSEEAQHYSHCVCTGLQLANFWQDIRRDYENGRIYIPAEDFLKFGMSIDDMPNCATTDPFQELIQFEVERADQMLIEGTPIVDYFPSPLQLDVSLFVRGGRSILQQIRAQKYDTWNRRPEVSHFTKLYLVLSAWWEIRVMRRKPKPQRESK